MVASTASLNINVKTNDVDRADRRLKGLTTQGKRTEAQVVRLQDRFKSFGQNASSAVAAVDGPLGGVSSRISAMTSVATRGGVAITALAVAVTGLTFVMQRGVRELDSYEIGLKRTEALLKATGFAAGVTAQQLEEEAQAIAFNTLASVEGIREAQSVILTFDRIQGDVRKNAVGLSQDMASVFGGTAASRATALGKALQDPIKGITALSLSGVTFNDTQKEQIRLLQESGELFEAQAIVIEAVKGNVDGVAKSIASGTIAGALDTTGQLFANISKTLAANTGVYDATLGFFDDLNESLKGIQLSIEGPNLEEITKQVEEQQDKIDSLIDERNETRQVKQRNVLKKRIIEEKNALAELVAVQQSLTQKQVEEQEKQEQALKASEDKKQEIRNEAIMKQIAAEEARLEEMFKLDEFFANRERDRKGKSDKEAADKRDKEHQDNLDAERDLANEMGRLGSSLVDATAAIAGEQSKAYRVAFALSKGFATAQAALNFNVALSQALALPADVTLPQKLASYASVASAGISVLSSLSSVSYNGGRLQGGTVGANDAVMVGERGPELFVPGNSGRVVNNNQLNNSPSGEMNITIVNQTTGRIDQVKQEQISRNDVVLIVQETMPLEIANANSRTSKALRNNTNSQRRLS